MIGEGKLQGMPQDVVVGTISIGPSISLGVTLSQKGEIKQKRRKAKNLRSKEYQLS